MHNIRKIGIRILLIIIVISLYQVLVEFVYRPYDGIVIQHNKERKQMEGTIETLLCGTSTAQRGFDPKVIDKELETVSFNIGTSLQPLDGTYHLIKDMAEKNPIETVFLTMAPDSMRRDVVATKYRGDVYDRLNGVGSKVGYLLDACDVEQWPYIVFYSTRVENYFDYTTIEENISTKLKEDYDTGIYCHKHYRGQGFMCSARKYKWKKVSVGKRKFDATSMVDKNIKYLDKIVEYCENNKIELIFIYAPLAKDELLSYKDFNQVHDYYAGLAESYGVEFWDFNYYNNMESLFTNKMFQDKKHLNVKGAKLFSEEVSKVYKAYHSGQDMSAFFMEDYGYRRK